VVFLTFQVRAAAIKTADNFQPGFYKYPFVISAGIFAPESRKLMRISGWQPI
jgi:hypothetical protein